MRAAILIVSAMAGLSLAACAARDPTITAAAPESSGSWTIEKSTDRITGAPVGSAYVSTRNSTITGEYASKPAMMQLTCFKDLPLVRFAFTHKVGTTVNSFLGYRFDDRPGHEIQGRFLHEPMTVVIEDPAEVKPFIEELRTANVLYIRIRSLNAGRTAAEFKVDGAAQALDTVFAACPFSAVPTLAKPPRGRGRSGSPA